MLHELLRGLHEDDRVAVVYPSRSDLGQDFTNDEGLLIRAVSNLRASIGGGPVPRWDLYFRNVLRSLASAPESRRAVILVSDISVSVLARDRYVLDESRRLNVPVYTIDPRGLMAPQLGLDAHMENQTPEARAGLDQAIGPENGLDAGARNQHQWARLREPVGPHRRGTRTAGRQRQLLRARGFYPDPAMSDGKFHDIDVRVRRPGVRMRSRAGYQADKPPSTATEGAAGDRPGPRERYTPAAI